MWVSRQDKPSLTSLSMGGKRSIYSIIRGNSMIPCARDFSLRSKWQHRLSFWTNVRNLALCWESADAPSFWADTKRTLSASLVFKYNLIFAIRLPKVSLRAWRSNLAFHLEIASSLRSSQWHVVYLQNPAIKLYGRSIRPTQEKIKTSLTVISSGNLPGMSIIEALRPTSSSVSRIALLEGVKICPQICLS